MPKSKEANEAIADVLTLYIWDSCCTLNFGGPERLYRMVLALDPLCPDSLENLGFFLYSREKNIIEAKSLFEKSIANGGGEWSYCLLAQLLTEQGEVQEAEKLIVLAIQKFGETEKICMTRSEIQEGFWDPL